MSAPDAAGHFTDVDGLDSVEVDFRTMFISI